MHTSTPVRSFTPADVEASCRSASGSIWFADLKRRHWQDFSTLPMPSRTMERWRFTKTSLLTCEGFELPTGTPLDASHRLMNHIEWASDVSARVAFVDNQLVAFGAEVPSGVRILTLAEWLQSSSGEADSSCSIGAEAYFAERKAVLGMDKFFALHNALLQDVLVIDVLPGTEVEKPIEIHYLASKPGLLLTPHTVIHAGANSRLTVIEYHGPLSGGSWPTGVPEDGSSPSLLSIGVASIRAGTGATVVRQVIQDHHRQAHLYQNEEAVCGRDAHVDSLQVNLGGAYARFEGHAIADGPGADVHLYSLAASTGEQLFDQRTLQTHKAPNARSNLLFKNALMDQSQTIFSGLIIVERDAQQTDAYQKNNNLLLSPAAEANSLPGLEIGANDVKCSHGATTGQVSPEELFYLNSRGIPDHAAFELLVFGFFEEVLEKLRNPEVHDRLAERVRNQWAR